MKLYGSLCVRSVGSHYKVVLIRKGSIVVVYTAFSYGQ